jgi:hypothetical protein
VGFRDKRDLRGHWAIVQPRTIRQSYNRSRTTVVVRLPARDGYASHSCASYGWSRDQVRTNRSSHGELGASAQSTPVWTPALGTRN